MCVFYCVCSTVCECVCSTVCFTVCECVCSTVCECVCSTVCECVCSTVHAPDVFATYCCVLTTPPPLPSPAHPRAELVYLQLICNGQVISQTEFEFYQTVNDDLSQIYHLLNNNMSAFFPTISGPFASPQSQGGQSSGMPNVYSCEFSSCGTT